jgi:GTP-binding protein EngB required for normal cell division
MLCLESGESLLKSNTIFNLSANPWFVKCCKSALTTLFSYLTEIKGVSNVGKSSLLNALTRQWGIVRTSDKPGLTQVS